MTPARIVSLFPCLDQILAAVGDPRGVAALSRYARDPAFSTVEGVWRRLPTTRGSAEELVALAPDLVLASVYTPPATLAVLRRLRTPVVLFDAPAGIAASVAQIDRIAALIGRPAAGRAETARVNAALAAAAPGAARRPRALVFQTGGYVAGAGTLMDALLERTGFANAARAFGLRGVARLDLEHLVSDPPAILFADVAPGLGASRAERLLRHPALAAAARAAGMRVRPSPQALFTCGGPAIATTVRALAAARRELLGVAA